MVILQVLVDRHRNAGIQKQRGIPEPSTREATGKMFYLKIGVDLGNLGCVALRFFVLRQGKRG